MRSTPLIVAALFGLGMAGEHLHYRRQEAERNASVLYTEAQRLERRLAGAETPALSHQAWNGHASLRKFDRVRAELASDAVRDLHAYADGVPLREVWTARRVVCDAALALRRADYALMRVERARLAGTRDTSEAYATAIMLAEIVARRAARTAYCS